MTDAFQICRVSPAYPPKLNFRSGEELEPLWL
jgi:hypothetical protein